MTVLDLTLVQLAGDESLPLLVVGPSLGTAVTPLWAEAVAALGGRFHVVGWELPGHGFGTKATEPFSLSDLADGLIARIGRPFLYAGESVAGGVGLALGLRAPDGLRGVVTLGAAARFSEPSAWADRAAKVRASGTSSLVIPSTERWFTPEFVAAHPEQVGLLLHTLRDADDESYALVCEALAAFDARDRLGEIAVPVLAVAGERDAAAPPEQVRAVAEGVRHGRYLEIPAVAHQIPVEAPARVAEAIVEFSEELS